ncbi:MAG: acyl-CoA dehydrogenase [Proteobacteria bacterium]|nr:acyl-CoA dehydrogenase [Pseudomonadota bacterium]
MANLIVDPRDQRFVLYEMLNVEELCKAPLYADFSRDMFDMALNEAEKFATSAIFPALAEGDREGCRLEAGNVFVPKCYHRCMQIYREGGWGTMSVSPETGGQGFPHVVAVAAKEWFSHNTAFVNYVSLTEGAAHLVEVYGTEVQKKKYLPKMHASEWGGTMALTEADAGTDVGNLKTKAIRQPDGTFRLQGTKIFITAADSDLMENIIHPVLARIEGDPPGTGGISIFLVPKYIINDDGTPGKRNDFTIGSLEEKMGLHGSATCTMNFGDNGECWAELLGEERQGMKIMFQMMNGARIGVGIQSLSSASIAYLHSLQYAKERLQGSSLMEMKNPSAPRVPIIQHPDVRRMLIWMKAHTEGFRALLYFTALCADRCRATDDEAEKDKHNGFLEVLTPICKAYCSDMGFRVTETAIQVYGGYGYCTEYPVEQFLRDEKIASIYEGTNGIQALDLVGRKLGLKKGMYFVNLLGEMGLTIAKYQSTLPDLAPDVQAAMNTLTETAMLFAASGKAGKFLIPVANAYPFLMLMGQVVTAWLLLWEAGVAKEKLAAPDGGGADKLFYEGKVATARYFIKHVLPEVDAAAKAIKSEDVSMMEIADEAFAS